MLNLIKSKTKKLICCFVLCLGVLVSAFAGYNISQPNVVMAKSTNKIVEDVTSSVFGSAQIYRQIGVIGSHVSETNASARKRGCRLKSFAYFWYVHFSLFYRKELLCRSIATPLDNLIILRS